MKSEDRNMIKGFLFDMDGTVFDTERVYFKAWHKTGELLGYDIPDELLDMMRGSSVTSAIKIFGDFFDGKHDYLEARKLRQQLADEDFKKNGVPLRPGARELVAYIREQGLKLALATSTYKEVVDFYLEDTGLTGAFDVVITGDMVKNGKPDPDIFITAAEKLGFRPEECAVCEDSLNGIKAGRSSGARVFYIPDLNRMTKEQIDLYVDETFGSLSDIIGYMEALKG